MRTTRHTSRGCVTNTPLLFATPVVCAVVLPGVALVASGCGDSGAAWWVNTDCRSTPGASSSTSAATLLAISAVTTPTDVPGSPRSTVHCARMRRDAAKAMWWGLGLSWLESVAMFTQPVASVDSANGPNKTKNRSNSGRPVPRRGVDQRLTKIVPLSFEQRVPCLASQLHTRT